MVVWVMLAEAGQKKLNSMHFKQSFKILYPTSGRMDLSFMDMRKARRGESLRVQNPESFILEFDIPIRRPMKISNEQLDI